MIWDHKIHYRDGELRVGVASWDDGSRTERSIKYAYRDKTGKISRGAPELPFYLLADMLKFAIEQNELDTNTLRDIHKVITEKLSS